MLETEIDKLFNSLAAEGVYLTETEFYLFETLDAQHPAIATHEQLQMELWGQAEGKEALLKNFASRLNAKFKATGPEPKYALHNIHSIGYWLSVNTQEGQEKLEGLKKTPMHEVPNYAVLAQVMALNIRPHPNNSSARLLFYLLGRRDQFTGREEIAEEMASQQLWTPPRKLAQLLRKNMKGALEINGFQYRLKTKRGSGYRISVTPAAHS